MGKEISTGGAPFGGEPRTGGPPGIAAGAHAPREGSIKATMASPVPVEKFSSKVMLLRAVYCAGPPVAGRDLTTTLSSPVPVEQLAPVLSTTLPLSMTSSPSSDDIGPL